MNDPRPVVGIINTLQASGDNVIDDTVAEQWGICDLNTDDPITNLHELIPYGKTLKVESFSAAAEVQQIVVIGGEDKEVIVASTRYKLEIHNPEDKYESHEQPPAVHAYSTGVAIPAADEARTLVYSALADKVNAYAGNNAAAYPLFELDFTAGGLTGLETPAIGQVLTQATSGATARVAAIGTITGSWGAGTAAGTIWLFDDKVATIADAAYTWAYGTSTLLQTISTLLLGQGLVVEDEAGYFISNLGRPGINWVGVTQGFTVASAAVALAGVYALGIGSVMAQLKPTYDFSKQMVTNHGLMEYEFTRGDVVDTTKSYTKIVFTVRSGDVDAIDYQSVDIDYQITIYADESNGTNLTDLLSAIATAAAK